MYIPGTTYLHILLHCTLYLIAHLTPYFISLFVSYFILTIFIYILSRVLFHSFYCFYVIFILLLLFFIFLHFPLSGPVLTNISLLIIPCMIVYVTNNKEPWNLEPSVHKSILYTRTQKYRAYKILLLHVDTLMLILHVTVLLFAQVSISTRTYRCTKSIFL